MNSRGFSFAVILVTATAACVPAPRMAVVPSRAAAEQCRAVESSDTVTVRWVIPDDARSRVRLDAACASVGPVVLQAGPNRLRQGSGGLAGARQDHGRAEADGPPAGEPIAVVTWNTYLGRGNLDDLVAQLQRGNLTGAPGAALVFLLQEVYRADILARARAFGLHALFVPTLRRPSDHDDRGNAILSTFPIGNVVIAELPFERQRRVAVAAEIRAVGRNAEARSFHAVSVHLTTTFALVRGGPSAARRRQAHALVEALNSIPPPIVIGGDLNTWWGEDEPAVKLLREAYPDALPLNARDTWRGPLGLGNKLDYLFARTGGEPLRVQRLPNRFGSDHYPLMTLMSLLQARALARAPHARPEGRAYMNPPTTAPVRG